MASQQRTTVHTGRDVDVQWRRMLDELSRRGVLSRLGAADALLSASIRDGQARRSADRP